MNTTMAPGKQINTLRSKDLRRRQNWSEYSIITKRQTESGKGNGSGKRNSRNRGDFSPDGRGRGGLGRGKSKGVDGGDDNDDKDKDDGGRSGRGNGKGGRGGRASNSTASALPDGGVTSIYMTTSVVIVTSTALLEPPSTTNTADSADSSSQPREGIDGSSDTGSIPTKESELFNQGPSTTSWPTVRPPETVFGQGVGPTSSPVSLPSSQSAEVTLQPMTQNFLIAAGTIGALIIVLAVLYVFARIKKVDLFAIFRNRELRKGGDGKWYGWRRKELVNSPPRYSSETFLAPFTFISDEKKPYFQHSAQEVPQQQHAPKYVPQQVTPQQQTTLAPVSPVSPMSVVFPPLHVANPDSQLSQAGYPSGLRSPLIARRSSPELKNQSGSQSYGNWKSNHENRRDDSNFAHLDNYSNTISTNKTIVSNNTANDAYDPAQREVNHLSYLSSLSSGFGDQILIPRLPPTQYGAQTPRKSTHSRKYSWTQATNDRDTQYTDASVESAPHYRTVHSWVSQQAGRNGRHLPSEDAIPKMPQVPFPLQMHHRNKSSNPAFRQHPGDEIELQKSLRIPSHILDKKTGMK